MGGNICGWQYYGGVIMSNYNASNDYSGHTYSVRVRPSIDFGRIGGQTKPTPVTLGAFSTLSLPIYNSDNEEIYFNHSVIRRWNGVSDIIVGCRAIIDTANTSKKFRLDLDWYNYVTGVVMPTAVNNVHFDKTTGTDAQYMSYNVTWTLNYDVVVANPIVADQILGGRIRRVAAPDAEITGEVMLHGFYVQYCCDKMGVSC
jgi:hypothetical protein